MKSDYSTVATDEVINQTVEALEANGFKTLVVENKVDAKKCVLDLIPKGSDAFTNTSVTLDETGISEAINNSGDYISVRNKMMEMWGDPEKKKEMTKLASTPTYTLGSVHALSSDGKLMVASASGSQIPGESFGSEHVIFVVGAQKIVKDLADGISRIEKHVVPQEDKRALAAYGSNTSFSKLLVLNKEPIKDRTTVVILKESIGY